MRRPEVCWREITERFPELMAFDYEVATQAEYDCKYSGYIIRQQEQVERQLRLASKRIPSSFSFDAIHSLRFEARQKLNRVRPTSLDQASRISGITPADIALVLAHLENRRRLGEPELESDNS
jgi:tRNA uridine 5-carboxymethylaminomethyl modification enzyme